MASFFRDILGTEETPHEPETPVNPKQRRTNGRTASGMNDSGAIARITIVWKNGVQQTYTADKIDQALEAIKKSKSTRRYWVHHKANLEKCAKYSDEDVIRAAWDAIGLETNDPKIAAAELGFVSVLYVCDESGNLILRNGKPIRYDTDPASSTDS